MKTPLSKTARTLPVVDRTSRVPIVSEEVKFLDSRSLPRLRAPSKLKLLGSNSSSCRQVSAGGAGPGCRAPGRSFWGKGAFESSAIHSSDTM
jgi:hypothetical protein